MRTEWIKTAAVLGVCFTTVFAWAQEKEKEKEYKAKVGRQGDGQQGAFVHPQPSPELQKTMKLLKETKVSLEWQDTMVGDALDMIAEASGITIEKVDFPETTVTSTLKDVPVAQALSAVSKLAKLAWNVTPEGKVRVFVPKANVKGSNTRTIVAPAPDAADSNK